MPKFDLVDKYSYMSDAHGAAFETIEADTRNKAKYIYIKLWPDSKYIDILCRKSRIGSFNIL